MCKVKKSTQVDVEKLKKDMNPNNPENRGFMSMYGMSQRDYKKLADKTVKAYSV